MERGANGLISSEYSHSYPYEQHKPQGTPPSHFRLRPPTWHTCLTGPKTFAWGVHRVEKMPCLQDAVIIILTFVVGGVEPPGIRSHFLRGERCGRKKSQSRMLEIAILSLHENGMSINVQ